MRWFFPTWNGDFRLQRIGKKKTLLSVVAPTEDELKVLGHLEALAKKKGWCAEDVQFWPAQEYRKNSKKLRDTELNVAISELGPLMVKELKPGKQTLTAIRFSDDSVEVVEGYEMELEELAAQLDSPKKKKPKAAVTAKRPTSCCPVCYVDAVGPATDALLAFMSDEQHIQWKDSRALVVRGGRSGHRYILAHRNSEIAANAGKVCWDVDEGRELHFHDTTVPPEEEVLGAMLMLQHREHWLRHEASVLGYRGDAKYKNPFGNGMDGVADATFTSQIGRFARNLLQ